ncbi:MAG: hypothetical protein ACT4OF_15910 [Caulobacteraceae bacterium]
MTSTAVQRSSIPHTPPPPPRASACPPEFLVAVRAAIVARTKRLDREHYYQAKVAEAVLTAALPVLAPEIRLVAARKGKSRGIGGYLGSRLDGPYGAALAVLWSIRNARLAGIYAVFRTSAGKPGFGRTLHRLLGQTEVNRLLRRVRWRGAIQP